MATLAAPYLKQCPVKASLFSQPPNSDNILEENPKDFLHFKSGASHVMSSKKWSGDPRVGKQIFVLLPKEFAPKGWWGGERRSQATNLMSSAVEHTVSNDVGRAIEASICAQSGPSAVF